LKVKFLGTGTSQGVPVIGCACEVCTSLDYRDKRLRSSVHIDVDGASLIIDTGPDFRQQMLREHISHIDAILFTHAHRDHTAGLDDIRSFNFLQKSAMPVFGSETTLKQIEKDFGYIFGPKDYPGLPRVMRNPITDEPFHLNGLSVTPLPVMHLNMPVYGFRIGNFSYVTDTNFIPDATLKLLAGSEVLVLNALQREQHISHFNLEEAIRMVERIQPGKAFFTHISHKLGRHTVVESELPGNIRLAYDGLQVTL
jgi:phosphoribosyl 1,2-cyclic phosphate phosphodiesterase